MNASTKIACNYKVLTMIIIIIYLKNVTIGLFYKKYDILSHYQFLSTYY